jgi:uncharacterized membrane protein
MEIRAGKSSSAGQERSLKDIAPNVAALLCYVGGWISGIVLLVLEQKNRYIRFHALQSIIVFGTLTLASIVLGRIPVAGTGFSVIIGITWFILWIILMVKAVNGEMFKLPWAGNLAERLANESIPPTAQPPVNNGAKNTEYRAASIAADAEASAVPPAEEGEEKTGSPAPENMRRAFMSSCREDSFMDKYYSASQRTGRMVGSAFAIAWSVALLIFFSFYSQYIAWYEPVHTGSSTQWQMHTLITADFSSWLPIVTAALVLSIIGHAVAITFDRYALRQAVRTILDVLNVVSVIALLAIFPFNFSILPSAAAADGVAIGLTIFLIFVAVCCGISALVNLIQLIVHSIKGEY